MIIESGKIYANLGWHVLPVRGKVPAGGNAWQNATTNDPDKVSSVLVDCDGVGVQLGPKSGIIDVECDSDEAYENLLRLMGGEIPEGVSFSSSRGNHYLFKWSPDFPFDKAVAKVDGIEFRIGTHKACQSVFPPSPGREWIVSPEQCEVKDFPAMEKLIELWSKSNAPKRIESAGRLSSLMFDDKIERARKYLETIEPAVSGSGGHNATYRAACKMVLGFDLSVDTAYNLMADVYNPHCQPSWTEKELRRKCEQADKQAGDRGYMLTESPKFEHYPDVDLSGILRGAAKVVYPGEDGEDDEDFFEAMVPQDGLLRQIFEYYSGAAYRKSNAIGLAIAVSICQTLFGRRVQTDGFMRTNDYNVIMAPTASGKEAAKTVCNAVFDAGVASARRSGIINPCYVGRVQSGNAVMTLISTRKGALWVCDEFGEMLADILDKKQSNGHVRAIGYHLLQIYGASASKYGGDAHSDGIRNEVIQPHLCVLGATTGGIFDSLKACDIHSGLIGRLAFWPLQKRPRRNDDMRDTGVPEDLANCVGDWLSYNPGFEGLYPEPFMMRFCGEAADRWIQHADAIDDKMDGEAETRAAVWARTAARSRKLALVHRAARFDIKPSDDTLAGTCVELIDVEWGIKMANWFSNLLCGLIRDNVVDTRIGQLGHMILESLRSGEQTARFFQRRFRKFTAGDIAACLSELEAAGKVLSRTEVTSGRPKNVFSLIN